MEENHAENEVIGTSQAPYINNTLVPEGAFMTNSFAIEHPSEPNYLDFFSGSNQGITSDGFDIPGAFSTPNLAGETIAAGFTFGAYIEDYPSNYDHDHAPWDLFTDVPASTESDFHSSWPTDFTKLPTISIVTPNVQDDMHDGTIQQGDAWLQQNIDSYAQWAKTHNSLLLVTWDEDDYTQNNQVATIFVGSMVVAGQYGEQIDHFSVLRTLEDMYGLPYAGASATANTISDIWSPSTGNPPAAPSNLTATAVSTSQINLAWSESSSSVTEFKIERSTDGVNFTQITTVGASVTAYNDTGLTANTTYFYRVRATNTAGDSAYSNVANDLTAAPAAPTNLTATAASTSQINLAWSENSSNVTEFKIERSTDGVNFTQITTVGAGVTAYNDTGLTANTPYFYRVRASNAVGDSAFSNQASATTAAPGAPAAPSNLTATAASASEIDLAWVDNANDETGFKIERSTDGTTFSQIAAVGASVLTFSDTGLAINTQYYYRVRATNALGDSVYSNLASDVTAVPAAPSNLTATTASGSEIDLAWQDSSSKVTGFSIERWVHGQQFTQITTVGANVTTYNDTGLLSGARYLYRVRAYNGVGNSAYSNQASAFTAGSVDRRFVAQVYYDVLDRMVDTAGLAFWSGLVDQGVSRTQVVLQIENSSEYRADVIQGLYSLLLHRQADGTGLDAFTNLLANGGTVEQAEAIIAGSDEYIQVRGGGTNDGFLDAIYQDGLGRAVDSTGRANFDQALAGGATRAQVATAIFTSGEYRMDLVQSLYSRFLQRNADGPGLNAWVSALQSGTSEEEVTAGIAGSGEYFSKL